MSTDRRARGRAGAARGTGRTGLALHRALLAGVLGFSPARAGYALTPASDPAIEHARAALVARFLDDRHGVESAHEAIRRLDLDRARDDREDTGLADQLHYLEASSSPSREAYLEQLRDALRSDPDVYLAGRMRWAMASDELVTAQRLMGAARHNRIANLVNDAARPLGRLTSIALSGLNPAVALTAALDSITATGGNLWRWRRPAAEEREALHRYREHLRRDAAPGNATSGDIIPPARMHRLAARVAAADCNRALRRARAAAEPATARAHLEAARLISGCETRARREEPPPAEPGPAAARDPRLRPADPLPRMPEVVVPTYHAMLLALVRAEPAAIRSVARELHDSPAGASLGDEAQYVETVAADLEGRHQDALTSLRALADAPSSNMGRHATELLRQPGTDRFGTLRHAVADHRRARVRYVLMGSNRKPLGDAHGLARAGLRGLQGLQNFGLFNVFGLVGRSVQVWRGDPVSNAPIIAAGEDLLAREPGSPHLDEARDLLVDAYSRSGEYERALFHLARMGTPAPKRAKKLRDRAASRLLRVARSEAFGPRARQRALDLMLAHYPDTESADDARELQSQRAASEPAQLPSTTLRSDRALAPRLGLPSEWLDGRGENGELADGDLRLADDGRLLAAVEVAGDRTDHSLSLDGEQTAVFVAAANETRHLTAARDAGGAPRGAPFERFLPFFVEGSVGASGVSIVPGLKPSPVQSDRPDLYDEN